MVDEHAGAPAPRPGVQCNGAKVWNIMGADDVETFVAHPAQVRRFFLGGKFVCQFLRDGGVLRHAGLRWQSPSAAFPSTSHIDIINRPRPEERALARVSK